MENQSSHSPPALCRMKPLRAPVKLLAAAADLDRLEAGPGEDDPATEVT